MTPEMLTIIGTGVALAVLIVPGQRSMQRGIAGLCERMARLEGPFKGFTGRQPEQASN